MEDKNTTQSVPAAQPAATPSASAGAAPTVNTSSVKTTSASPSTGAATQGASRSKLVPVLLVVLILIILAVIAAFLATRSNVPTESNGEQATNGDNNTEEPEEPTTVDEDEPVAGAYYEYDVYADDFITFDHPEGWTAEVDSGATAVEGTNPGVQSVEITDGSTRLTVTNNTTPYGYGPGRTVVDLNNLNRFYGTGPEGFESEADYDPGTILYYKYIGAIKRYAFVFSGKPVNSEGTALASSVMFSMQTDPVQTEIPLDLEYPGIAFISQSEVTMNYIGAFDNADLRTSVEYSADCSAATLDEAKACVEVIERFFTTAARS